MGDLQDMLWRGGFGASGGNIILPAFPGQAGNSVVPGLRHHLMLTRWKRTGPVLFLQGLQGAGYNCEQVESILLPHAPLGDQVILIGLQLRVPHPGGTVSTE
jgi:hypothetical protein